MTTPRFRVRNQTRAAAVVGTVLLLSQAVSGSAQAMIGSGPQAAASMNAGAAAPVPFTDFVASLRRPDAVRRLSPSLAAGDAEEMRQYLLKRYDGVRVAHSFLRDGQVFDCMDEADQPAVRQNAPRAVAAPPPFLPQGGVGDVPQAADADPFGNLQSCAEGTVPIRRVTPDEVARFGTLRRFFAKDLSSAAPARGDLSGLWVGDESEPGSPRPHQEISLLLTHTPATGALSGTASHAESGSTDNAASATITGAVKGKAVTITEGAFYVQNAAPGTHWCSGTGTLTYSIENGVPTLSGILRAPGCEPASVKLNRTVATHKYAVRGEYLAQYGGISVMSLWRPALRPAAGHIFSLSQEWYVAGSGSGTQTAEVGWQEYPQKYGNFKPVFFTYWTADDYNRTGCYNTDCTAYVQTSNKITPGTAFSKWGLDGTGGVYVVTAGYYLYNHNWWLSYGNSWVGYYPASLYRGGPMATRTAYIEYGGETVGTGSWPAMGSGKFANQTNAAFHKQVAYRDAAGTQHSAALNFQIVSNTACYTDSANYHGGAGSGSYFFFGGPGGRGC